LQEYDVRHPRKRQNVAIEAGERAAAERCDPEAIGKQPIAGNACANRRTC